MNIIPFPALVDNYIWVLEAQGAAVVVDPPESGPLLAFLAQRQLTLTAIWLTHHHDDHCAGTAGLSAAFPQAQVYGPANEGIAGLSHPLQDAGPHTLAHPALTFEVLCVPGHTAGHVAYWVPDHHALFCGDTLFSVGCGRNFEGSFATLRQSLAVLQALPDETQVFCAHEYTLSNIAFAKVVEPVNEARDAWESVCIEKRRSTSPSLPSTLALEKAINPFLRTEHPAILASVSHYAQRAVAPGLDCFSVLRTWKNGFRP